MFEAFEEEETAKTIENSIMEASGEGHLKSLEAGEDGYVHQ